MTVAENWSNLPRELVENVAEFLTSYGDYIRARAVCLSWQSPLPKTPKHLPTTQFPLLMLPGGTDTHKDLFSLAENKSYRFEFPSVHYNSIRGSSHGWLVIKNGNSSLGLLNPFTKAYIDLPSLGLPAAVFDNEYKFVLSSSPSSSDFMAIASCRFFERLWFYRCGYKRWTDVDVSPSLRSVQDLIFHKNQIVAVRTDGEVLIMEINIPDDKNSSSEIKVKQILIAPFAIPDYFNLWLVESGDELLVVGRFINYRRECHRATQFAVYRLDWNKSSTTDIEAKWFQVKSLDNRMIFLGMSSSSYFCSSDFHRCRGNSLYFFDDLANSYSKGILALFDLEDKQFKQIKSFPYNLQTLKYLPAIWITPSLI